MKHSLYSMTKSLAVCAIAILSHGVIGCSPQAGPDKSFGGMVLGAGWGAGAGAVVGNQVGAPGEGVAVGAGFGAAAGLLHGIGYDLTEGVQLEQNRKLDSLKVQAAANQRHIESLQHFLDESTGWDPAGGVYQVFFDEDQTNMRLGAVTNLEQIAESIKSSGFVRSVHVVGHTDDSGNTKYNETLSLARANTVKSYLSQRGIPVGQIEVESFGATRPIATNATTAGRQLNRRVDVYITR
jgi:outer membrane protein OmpA-like peptidoglycan-associated protein